MIAMSLLVALCWSVSPIVNKLLSRHLPLPAIMLAVATVNLVAISMYVTYQSLVSKAAAPIFRAPWQPWMVGGVLTLAIVSGVIPYVILLHLIKHHDASLVTALTATSPAITAVLACVVFGEQMTVQFVTGLMLIVSGVAVLALQSRKAQ